MQQPIFLYSMPSQILLATHIKAPVEKVFDIARNIDVHVESTKHTGEQAIAGRTSGLIELGETVTWRAKHFGVWQNLTSKITEMEYPNYFTDIQVEGAFKSFTHEHYFYPILNQTMMRDIFTFESPGGILGEAVNYLFLSKYMTRLLLKRNEVIKQIAEGQ
ncbi:Ligand-binding SRPBCC domain-containing protein [Mucilaginibacter gossypiicola]|uniref:Ligand-binding SRPBCC domain-containing protein n=1 Tax=Mucilaginibacter gossypiicola TaxID=551995 RepID=A0A1H8MW13_9SPHI|nr:SRPBCC family protein [Mucilaginibacter gossypiicola]SEO21585.1 Ligand-binding SRPBCC domain-containing protein [Mucilaginibacter gossypiicola]